MNKHHRRLLGINRARRVARVYRSIGLDDFYDEDDRLFKRMIHTRVPCSCYMCGNPRRRHGEKTYQEKKADLDLQDE
jgi:hypothetical protein